MKGENMTEVKSSKSERASVGRAPIGRLFVLDLSGNRVLSLNPDGSDRKVVVTDCRMPDGIAVDVEGGHIYWTKKGPDDGGLGRILRANIELPTGQIASDRTDIEVLFDDLPEPIDLELDLKNRLLYWTDRGDPPRGNTVNRAPLDVDKKKRPAPEILYQHLMEGIGIAIDFKGGRMFFTDLAGSVYVARLDGSEKRTLLAAQGNLTGIAYVEIHVGQAF